MAVPHRDRARWACRAVDMELVGAVLGCHRGGINDEQQGIGEAIADLEHGIPDHPGIADGHFVGERSLEGFHGLAKCNGVDRDAPEHPGIWPENEGD